LKKRRFIDPPALAYSRLSFSKMSVSGIGEFVPIMDIASEIPHITPRTLHGLLTGEYDDYFRDLYVIDCRYDYEYEAGHITGALHLNNPEELRNMFFLDIDRRSVLVFHCELSQNRGPTMAKVLRDIDRTLNAARYPTIFYPHVYILDGGFREYQKEFKCDCEGVYKQMKNPEFARSGQMGAATTEWRERLTKYHKWRSEPIIGLAAAAREATKFGLEAQVGHDDGGCVSPPPDRLWKVEAE
jgi:M-phase inducer tyrosine phosphatase